MTEREDPVARVLERLDALSHGLRCGAITPGAGVHELADLAEVLCELEQAAQAERLPSAGRD